MTLHSFGKQSYLTDVSNSHPSVVLQWRRWGEGRNFAPVPESVTIERIFYFQVDNSIQNFPPSTTEVKIQFLFSISLLGLLAFLKENSFESFPTLRLFVSVCLRLYFSVSVCLSIRQSIEKSVQLSVCQPVCLFVCLPLRLSASSSVHLSVCPPVRLFISLYVYFPSNVCISVCPSICLSVPLSVCSLACPSVCPSVCP
jgi:hypothetical protein